MRFKQFTPWLLLGSCTLLMRCGEDSKGGAPATAGATSGGAPAGGASSGSTNGGSSNGGSGGASAGGLNEGGAPDGSSGDGGSNGGESGMSGEGGSSGYAGSDSYGGASGYAGSDSNGGSSGYGGENAGGAGSGGDGGSSGDGGSAGSSGGAAGSGGSAGSAGNGGAGGSGCVNLTVRNFSSWCSVSVAGGAASNSATRTVCVPEGEVALTASPISNNFLVGLWHHTDGDSGTGDAGTVQGSQFSTTVTMSGPDCVWVCCPFANGTGCPTTDPCL